MAEHNNQNLEQPNMNEPGRQNPDRERAVGAAAGASYEQTEAQALKAQRGGEQEDQIAGETAEGAQNQQRQNRNPSGHDPEGNAEGGDNF
jgi:hypothetical protein